MTEEGDSNDIRSTYDEIDEEDEVFQSDYTEIDSIHYVKDADSGSITIGATRAHHLYASTHGGYESVNATETEYRNHKRDLNAYIGEGDAQMLITKMTNRKLHFDNFLFEYVVENSQLSALFWADEMSKYNYKEFGDTISFDATFRTNKYNMVFVPFTCIDNHRKYVTFGDEILDDSTMQKIPRFKTKLPIERYAQKKYTKTMFTLIQEEINPVVYDCHQISESLENGIKTVTIKEIREIKVNTSRKKYNFGETSVQRKRNQTKKELRFKVSTDKSDGSVLCSCMNFVRFRFLCRHIFCVLKGNGLEVIFDKYIERSATVYSAVEYCLNLLEKDEEKLIEFVEKVKRLKTEVEEANPNAKQLSKREMFNLILGVEKPEVNTVKNPEPCSNKGNASGGQRKKGEIEKLREHMKKHMRLCKKCEKYRRHDSRNCPKKDDEIPTDSDSTINDLGTGTADDNCEDNENDQVCNPNKRPSRFCLFV
nr:protein FAR1-related sequence 5-like [Tanacetum cinerariifolium]